MIFRLVKNLFPVLSQSTRLTNGQTDGQPDEQTEFSLLDRVCIPCSAVKTGLRRSLCVCVSVCPHCHCRISSISWSIFTKIDADVRTPKVKTSSLGVNIAPLHPPFCPQNQHFRSRGPENPSKY